MATYRQRQVNKRAQTDMALEPDPLVAERFASIDDLRARLLELGPKPDTYDRVFDLVGPEEEDEAKAALAAFFSGSPTALCFLYRMLIRAGKANPIDEKLVEEIKQMHPKTDPENNSGGELKEAGLFLPKSMIKQASGGEGGPNNGEKYTMHGPEQTRYCPKLRNLISTHNCRYHCLDGLNIGDAETVCGEAIWRGAIADKYSREFRDADGNWTGGYIRGRFVVENDTAGNDYQLLPGRRARPIKENAWSTEKRLAEMRKSEGESRGYSGAPKDEEDLYNFDPHDIAPGPKNVQLDAKERDSIAKNASSEHVVKTAAPAYSDDPWLDEGIDIDPWEDDPAIEEVGDVANQDGTPTTYGELVGDDEDLLFEPEEPYNHWEPDAPEEGDVITTDRNEWYQYGKLYHVGDEKSLKAKMEAENFVPDVWEISDNGNPVLISNSIYGGSFATMASRRGKKKRLNRRASYTGDNLGRDVLSAPDVATPKASDCTVCGNRFDYNPGQVQCPKCGGKLRHLSAAELTQQSGGIAKVKSFAGVYEARIGRLAAYGQSEKEAVDKLEEMQPWSVQQTSEAVIQELQEDEQQQDESLQELQDQPAPQPSSDQQPAPVHAPPPPPKQPEELDAWIIQDIAIRDPEDQEEIDDLADSIGLGEE